MTTVEQRRRRLSEIKGRGISVPNGAHLSVEHDVPPDPIRKWSWWAHIWGRPSASTWTQNPSLLDAVQDDWDRSERFVTAQLELAAERDARKTEAQREADAAEAAKRQADADALKDELRRKFLAMPGTSDAEFEQQYPALLADHRRREMDQADRADNEVREAIRRTVLSNF